MPNRIQETTQVSLSYSDTLFIWNKSRQIIFTALRERLKYTLDQCFNHLSANEYIYLLKNTTYYNIYLFYWTQGMFGCEMFWWNVSGVQGWSLTKTLKRVTVYRESLHAHYLVYKATVQKSPRVKHWALQMCRCQMWVDQFTGTVKMRLYILHTDS